MRFLLILALATLGASWPSARASASTVSPQTGPDHRTLTVVMDDNYPPYIFRRADGTMDGLLVDAWKLWERKTGVPVKLVATDWAKAQGIMAAGQADVIDTVFRTPARERTLDFTPAYADIPVPIYVHRSIGAITDTASLRSFVVAVKSGDACIDRLREAGVMHFRPYPSYDEIVAAAVANEARLFCMDEPPASYLLYKAGADKRFNKAFVLYTGHFHRAVHKGDVATLALVNRGFAAFTPTEQQALRDKWMGTELNFRTWSPYVYYGLIASAAGVTLILVWGMTLRRVVRRRTNELHEQRQRLRTLVNTLPDLVWLKDLEGRYVTCNPSFERFFGATEAEVVGKTDYDFVDKETADIFRANDNKAIELNCSCVNEEQLTVKDTGYQGFFETIKTPLRDATGQIMGVLGIARDVSQYRQTQEHLQRVNRLYRVLTGLGDAIATAPTRQALYEATCQHMVSEGGVLLAWIGESDAASGRIEPVACAGEAASMAGIAASTADEQEHSPTKQAFRLGRTVTSRDGGAGLPSTNPDHPATGQHGPASCAAFPIKAGGQTRAVLSVYSDREAFFDAAELQLLERLAEQVGMALQAAESEVARTHAETALRASEERFSSIFRASPVGLAMGRLSDGTFLDVNDAWLDLFGFRRADVLGRGGVELHLWRDPQERTRVMRQLATTGHVETFDAAMCRADGTPLDVALTLTQTEIGAEQFVLGSFVDVSLRRQAAKLLEDQAENLEQMVAQRTAELNSIFLALPDLYFRVASDGRVLDYRAGRQGDLLVAPDQFMGRRVQDVLPADVGRRFQQIFHDLRPDTEPQQIEYSLPLPSGETHFEARVLPLREGEAIVVVRNISERKAYEQAREAAREESERLSKLRSEFLANMSHEVRTPLNGIMGLAQIGWSSTSGQPVHGVFGRILDSCKLLLGIIHDILDFSKIDANRLTIESTVISPRSLIEDAVEATTGAALAKGLPLRVEIDVAMPQRCFGDPLRLRQILLNLLANAIKFTDAGSVRLWAGCEAHQLVVRVSDTGIGITEQQLEQLFVPFQQADSSTTRRFGGTGLGLSISRRLAQLMDGDITVHSEVGLGSTFELRLPLREAADSPAADPAGTMWTAQGKRLTGLHLLVAEDNPVNQTVIESALQMEGAAVTLVEDGLQAVDQIRVAGADAFDLVLMDVQMPVMDGYAATRAIHDLAPELPVVGQTAHAMLEERDLCLAAGMLDVIIKPIDLETLVVTILRHVHTLPAPLPAEG